MKTGSLRHGIAVPLALAALLFVVSQGCSAAAETAPEARAPTDRRGWLVALSEPAPFVGFGATPPASVAVSREIAPAANEPSGGERGAIGASAADGARPRGRGRRIDLSLRGADLQETCRLLAEVGRFNVVIGEGVGGSVSVSLRNVDPYDALVAIASAHGADVRIERGLVLVTK